MESSFHMALLVEVDNAAARRPYERLGFRTPSRGSTTSALIEQLKDEDFSPPFEFPYPIDFFAEQSAISLLVWSNRTAALQRTCRRY
jgi:hypothetical protein